MAVRGNISAQRRRGAEVAEKVRSVPLWSVTTWDKKFNTVAKDKQKKVIKYHYFLASELEPIVEIGGTVKILTTYESDLWTAESKVQGCVSEGEVVSIPWGGNPNVQYFKGKFVTADNRIATSSDTSILSNRYLFYFMLAKKDLIGSFYRGASLKHPEMSKVLDMMIPLPPLSEQKRIAGELDKICELKKNAEMRLEKLDLLVKSRFVEMFGDDLSCTGQFETAKVANVADVGSSKRIFQNEYVSQGIPFYRTKEIVELSHGKLITTELYISHARYAMIKEQYGVPKKGDLLISAVGTIGEIWIVDGKDEFYFKDGNLMQIRPGEQLDSIYLRQCLNVLIQHFKRMIPSGTAYAALTIDSVKKMVIPIPPLSLQREFAAFVEKVDKLKEVAKKSVKQMDVLYRAKLQECFG